METKELKEMVKKLYKSSAKLNAYVSFIDSIENFKMERLENELLNIKRILDDIIYEL